MHINDYFLKAGYTIKHHISVVGSYSTSIMVQQL